MKKHILTALFIMLSFSTAFAAPNISNITTDEKGNTTGTIDGKKVDLHTDQYGNTKGTIGSARINTHTDDLGNTTGKLGKQAINTNLNTVNTSTIDTDEKSLLKPRGTITNNTAPATIGGNIVNSYTDSSQNTTGKGGARNINKRGSDGMSDGF